MKNTRGFTLLELLIVVVILGILASLAIPRYEKTVEKARGAEAITNLNALRIAELDFFGRTDTFADTTNFIQLAIEDPNSNPRTYFNYLLSSSDPDNGTFYVAAKRKAGSVYTDRYISMDQNGNLCGDWPPGTEAPPGGGGGDPPPCSSCHTSGP